MRFKVELTPQSDVDLAQIIAYIALDSILDAIRTNDDILDRIEALGEMPYRYPEYERDPVFRRMVVGQSFAVYYQVDEAEHLVKIARIYRTERRVDKVMTSELERDGEG